jgi:S-adenosylmethionine:tRNA ribosyltransferase-isomerase
MDAQFAKLSVFLHPGDLLLFNNSKVIPARLYGQKESGGRIEMLVERLVAEQRLLVQMRASHPPKPGNSLAITQGERGETVARATVLEREGAFFLLEFDTLALPLLAKVGELPLPPYIERKPQASDQDRYQTVYALTPGAVAAPTAGLHFTQEHLGALQAKGVEQAFITLHVGSGTFSPVRTENLAEHKMHAEWYEISPKAAQAINATRQRGGRVVCVGTTSLRALESAANEQGLVAAGSAETAIFITPGYRFKAADMLLTNFHLPKSTLMMLVSAFAGVDEIRRLYTHAIQNQYRFFSYGDAMLLSQQPYSHDA